MSRVRAPAVSAFALVPVSAFAPVPAGHLADAWAALPGPPTRASTSPVRGLNASTVAFSGSRWLRVSSSHRTPYRPVMPSRRACGVDVSR